MSETTNFVKVEYCKECFMPFEYCEYSPKPEKCKAWAIKNAPHLLESLSIIDDNGGEAEVGEEDDKKHTKRGGKGSKIKSVMKEEPKKITVQRAPRGKNKSTTVIKNLGTHGVDLKAAAKFFASRFACGSSVTGTDEIVIQGDVKDDLFDVIPGKFKEITEDDIDDLGPAGTWTKFHCDVLESYSWSANICGKKQWFFVPKGKEVLFSVNKFEFVSDIRDLKHLWKEAGVYEVIQNPGEVMFVPSGTYHQVHNLDLTVSINHNFVNASNITRLFDLVMLRHNDFEKELEDVKKMNVYTSQEFMDKVDEVLKADLKINIRLFVKFIRLVLKDREEDKIKNVTIAQVALGEKFEFEFGSKFKYIYRERNGKKEYLFPIKGSSFTTNGNDKIPTTASYSFKGVLVIPKVTEADYGTYATEGEIMVGANSACSTFLTPKKECSSSVSSFDGSDLDMLKDHSPAQNVTMDYLISLLKEKKQLLIFPQYFPNVDRLLDEEISRVRMSLFQCDFSNIELELPEPEGDVSIVQEKVYVPKKEHPDYNFVGRILGPRGMTAKQLEQETSCKVMVRGKGSMRDRKKEDNNRGKPNWEHLDDDLHVLIQCEDTPNRAAIKIKNAMMQVDKLLVPAPEGSDELKRKQLMELAIINGTYRPATTNKYPISNPRLLPPLSMLSPSSMRGQNRTMSCQMYGNSPFGTPIRNPPASAGHTMADRSGPSMSAAPNRFDYNSSTLEALLQSIHMGSSNGMTSPFMSDYPAPSVFNTPTHD
uniref:JmjC domain-containing protein n=1 Tax=Rhabditophanes sp. KR3021 TaxID=114890 RepID=A0AC35U0N6_9BILA